MSTHPRTVLTDDNARQFRINERGELVRHYTPIWYPPQPDPDDIPQPWHFRLFHALLRAAAWVRW